MNLLAMLAAAGRMPPQLVRFWTKGKGAAEIVWGTKGSFERCQEALATHGVPRKKIDGACARLHKKATGRWPNQNK